MEQRRLTQGKKIPITLSGGFYYFIQKENKSDLDFQLKKLNKPKSKVKIIKYEIPKEKSFFDWLFNSKKSSNFYYVAYVKD
jgi:hypothetical protein